MMNEHTDKQDQYRIVVSDLLDSRWQEWFENFTIRHSDDGNTILCGPIRDQSELHGLLRKINNLGLTLISVNIENNKEK